MIEVLHKRRTNRKLNTITMSYLCFDNQELINLICDLRAMEEAVVEMKYDAKKAPLGEFPYFHLPSKLL